MWLSRARREGTFNRKGFISGDGAAGTSPLEGSGGERDTADANRRANCVSGAGTPWSGLPAHWQEVAWLLRHRGQRAGRESERKQPGGRRVIKVFPTDA